MVHSVRSASLQTLADELEAFARDRDSHGKHDRARGAREAVAALSAGAPSTTFESVTYMIGEPDRFTAWLGTRDEIVAELHDASTGWAHHGKDELAFAARAAAGKITAGETMARVGHIEYRVCNSA